MKNVLIGLLFLGFTSLSFGQQDKIAAVELSEVNISPLNLSYLNKVQDATTPQKAKKLENVASRYDITEAEIFNRQFEAYEVVFKEGTGIIIATFDKNGKILSSLEKFKDIALPPLVRISTVQNYPGWAITHDNYLVSYYENKDVSKTYKLKLRKDKKRKVVRMDIHGNIMK